MTRTMTIRFDTTAMPREERVAFAVVPIDGVTGAIVRSGVRVKLQGLRDRAVVNRSGMFVFINLPDQSGYDVEIDATEAGFFGPRTIAYLPPASTDPDQSAKRRVDVLLEPRPNYRFPAGATLVRGVIVNGSAAVEGARIACRPEGSLTDFEGRSAENGAFALGLRLPPPADFDTRKPVEVAIRLSKGGAERVLTRKLTGGRSHSFNEPVDLGGSNEPDFFVI